MDGASVRVIVRVVYRITIRRRAYSSINEDPEATPIVSATTVSSDDRCAYTFATLVSYFIGIGCIVLGAKYINSCPAEKMLPIGLIIYGGIFVVGRLLNFLYDFQIVFRGESPDVPEWLRFLSGLLTLAGIGIFFTMFYWLNNVSVEKAYKDPKNYCDPTLCSTIAYGILFWIIFGVLPCLYECCCKSEN